MAKRFTDTEKWEDPWFRKLPNPYKLLWIYLLDKCDVAGVWKVDLELAGHLVVNDWEFFKKEECLRHLNNRIHVFGAGDGEKWFIPKFIKFQYDKLTPLSRPHLKVINLLKEYELIGIVQDRVCDRVCDTLKDKDKDKYKYKEERGGIRGREISSLFDEVWNRYPSKTGRKQAMVHFKASVHTEQDLNDINNALDNYLKSDRVKNNYIQNGSTWFNNWRDWINNPIDKPELTGIDKYLYGTNKK